jgi:protein-tyrosine-phosphatase
MKTSPSTCEVIRRTRTARVEEVLRPDDLVVAVCDTAYEELGPAPNRLHWSVPDPIRAGMQAAFERAYEEIEQRVDRLVGGVEDS